MDAIEQEMRRKATVDFIEPEPFLLTLRRRPLIPDGAGGYKRGPEVPLAVQTMRLVSSNNQLPLKSTVDGREVQPEFLLVCRWDADVAAGDLFTLDATRYEVLFVYPNRTDATRAEVGYGR